MLHILLLILKIIGIVLLVILGFLLAAVLLVLLVPLRYRLDGSWHGGPAGQVRVTWLLHAVSVLAAYENGLDITAKLFGFTVMHTAFGGESEGADEAGEQENGPDGTPRPADEADMSDGDGAAADMSDGDGAAADTPDGDGAAADMSDGDETVADMPDGNGAEADIADDGETVGAMSLETSGGAGAADGAAEDTFEAAGDVCGAAEPETADPGAEEPIAEGIDVSALPDLDEQLRQDEAEPDDTDLIDRIEEIFDRIGEKLEWADRKRRWVERFLEDPKNRKTIRLVWRQATAILKHILPQKAAGQVTFGFDDPATTGKALAACSVLYAMYGTELTVTPDFGNAVIDGDLRLKGRVRAGTLAVRAVRVLIDRNLWRMIKQVKKFLESGGK